jgi:hypothetical protein
MSFAINFIPQLVIFRTFMESCVKFKNVSLVKFENLPCDIIKWVTFGDSFGIVSKVPCPLHVATLVVALTMQ